MLYNAGYLKWPDDDAVRKWAAMGSDVEAKKRRARRKNERRRRYKKAKRQAALAAAAAIDGEPVIQSIR